MSLISISRCKNCGKEYSSWSCDYCYTKLVMKQVRGDKFAKIR